MKLVTSVQRRAKVYSSLKRAHTMTAGLGHSINLHFPQSSFTHVIWWPCKFWRIYSKRTRHFQCCNRVIQTTCHVVHREWHDFAHTVFLMEDRNDRRRRGTRTGSESWYQCITKVFCKYKKFNNPRFVYLTTHKSHCMLFLVLYIV